MRRLAPNAQATSTNTQAPPMTSRYRRAIAILVLALTSAAAGYAAAIYSARSALQIAYSLSMADLLRVEAEEAYAALQDKDASPQTRMWALKHHVRVLRSIAPSEPFLPHKAIQTDIALALGRLALLYEELGDMNAARLYYTEAINTYSAAQGDEITRVELVSLIRTLDSEPGADARSFPKLRRTDSEQHR